MTSTVKRIVCVGVCASVLTACTADQQTQGLGALIGAAGGAATGALAGKGDTTAILAGAAAGALVGWGAVKLTQYHAEKTRSAEEEAEVLGYEKSDGTLLRIKGLSVDPQEISPGQEVSLHTEYSVLTPQSSKVGVTETVELWKDNRMLQKVDARVEQRDPGEWKRDAVFPIPSNAEPGTYVVKSRVEGGGRYDERETHFVVGA